MTPDESSVGLRSGQGAGKWCRSRRLGLGCPGQGQLAPRVGWGLPLGCFAPSGANAPVPHADRFHCAGLTRSHSHRIRKAGAACAGTGHELTRGGPEHRGNVR